MFAPNKTVQQQADETEQDQHDVTTHGQARSAFRRYASEDQGALRAPPCVVTRVVTLWSDTRRHKEKEKLETVEERLRAERLPLDYESLQDEVVEELRARCETLRDPDSGLEKREWWRLMGELLHAAKFFLRGEHWMVKAFLHDELRSWPHVRLMEREANRRHQAKPEWREANKARLKARRQERKMDPLLAGLDNVSNRKRQQRHRDKLAAVRKGQGQ